jgi:ABC-type Zn uptake system ZnuABC Zn-binding protein ZnuA
LALGLLGVVGGAAEASKSVLCTTFPVYQFTRVVAAGREGGGVTVTLMLPAGLGCPHDYVLTPQDMAKVAGADILVVNGLGLEEFLGAPIQRANRRIRIVDSTVGIPDLLEFTCEEDLEHHGGHGENCEDEDEDDDEHEHGHGHDCEHEHVGVNPHLFASPRMAAKMVMNIAAGLAAADPAGAALYAANAKAYAGRLETLSAEFVAAGKTLRNNRIVTQHGVFDYLARDMGIDIVAVVQAHAGQEPAAAEMLSIIKTIRATQAGAIFTEPQYPEKVAQTIAKETGIATAMIDPVASGPDDAKPDYYESTMRQNLATLRRVLGEK